MTAESQNNPESEWEKLISLSGSCEKGKDVLATLPKESESDLKKENEALKNEIASLKMLKTPEILPESLPGTLKDARMTREEFREFYGNRRAKYDAMPDSAAVRTFLVHRQARLEKLIGKLKLDKHAAALAFDAKLQTADREERERLKLEDKKYQPVEKPTLGDKLTEKEKEINRMMRMFNKSYAECQKMWDSMFSETK